MYFRADVTTGSVVNQQNIVVHPFEYFRLLSLIIFVIDFLLQCIVAVESFLQR